MNLLQVKVFSGSSPSVKVPLQSYLFKRVLRVTSLAPGTV